MQTIAKTQSVNTLTSYLFLVRGLQFRIQLSFFDSWVFSFPHLHFHLHWCLIWGRRSNQRLFWWGPFKKGVHLRLPTLPFSCSFMADAVPGQQSPTFMADFKTCTFVMEDFCEVRVQMWDAVHFSFLLIFICKMIHSFIRVFISFYYFMTQVYVFMSVMWAFEKCWLQTLRLSFPSLFLVAALSDTKTLLMVWITTTSSPPESMHDLTPSPKPLIWFIHAFDVFSYLLFPSKHTICTSQSGAEHARKVVGNMFQPDSPECCDAAVVCFDLSRLACLLWTFNK